MTILPALTTANAIRWGRMKLTRNFTATAKRLVESKARYQSVEAKTGVPWFVIAVIHEREADQNWNTQLGQGDPLHEVSRHIPRGRGPFKTWEDGAIDALVETAPYAATWTNWTAGGAMCLLEQYNGTGYAARGEPSPYVWSGTDQYVRGKYIRDGVYDPRAVDSQLGCAGLIMTMMELDPTISFGAPTMKPAAPSEPPLPTSLWTLILSIIRMIFRRK